MENKNLKRGIIGLGMVGGALKRYFATQNEEVLFYDKGDGDGSMEEVNNADVIFICVPTPFKEDIGFDLSFVQDACSKIDGQKIIVLKSTIIPGTTNALQKQYSQHKFLFNPEFLTEATVDQDMCFPNRQIIGYTENSREVADMVLNILPKAPFKKVMPASEAEMVKYFSNTWFATKVVFANQMYDLCQKIGVNYELVKEAASADKMIGSSHLEIFHKGYRGYGGKCLPKDIRALIQLAQKNGVDLRLHKVVEEINNNLAKNKEISNGADNG